MIRISGIICALLTLVFTSCALFVPKVNMVYVINEKKKLDNAENPAKKYFIKMQLSEKVIKLENVLVKNVTTSTNIDYDFCVIVDMIINGKKVECYIYTKNIRKISHLKKGVSRITVHGEFYRFFTMLDDYYTKIEIINSSIDILNTKNKKIKNKIEKKETKTKQNNKEKDSKKKVIKKNKKQK